MWYLLLTLYLPLQDKELYVRFDDFRSEAPCMQAKIKLMEHQADLMKKSLKKSFITKIECREVGQASTFPNEKVDNNV
jgi:hypothetical protein